MARTAGKDSGHSFEDYFKRATSPMLTLLLLSEEPMYVYRLSQELKKRSDFAYSMSFLYPVLYRLQEQGYVYESAQEISDSHRVRNYYSITESGRQYLADIVSRYHSLLAAVDKIVDTCALVNNEDKKDAE